MSDSGKVIVRLFVCVCVYLFAMIVADRSLRVVPTTLK